MQRGINSQTFRKTILPPLPHNDGTFIPDYTASKSSYRCDNLKPRKDKIIVLSVLIFMFLGNGKTAESELNGSKGKPTNARSYSFPRENISSLFPDNSSSLHCRRWPVR